MFRSLAAAAALALLSSEGAALAQVNPFSDSMVQAPELHAPARGSITGQYANTAFGPGDVTRGTFSLPLPVSGPDERGGMQADPFPSYSSEAGASEWGIGWQSSNLSIYRTRILGDLDYATDERGGPWGRMVRGSDGNWYPEGLRSPVRVVDTGSVLVAYTPDGAMWSFGGADVLGTAKGTYAWYLESVVDVLGRKTSFAYLQNASGRLFLSDVTYGGTGSAPAYHVHLTYENLSVPLTDYRAGAPLVLDRRVQGIAASVIGAAGVETPRWSYALGYTQDAPGPAFYLASVQQTFASGEQPPPITYSYGTESAYLATAAIARAPKLDALLTLGPAYSADVIQPNRSTAFDADDDGRLDLEFGYDDSLLRQTDTGFTTQALSPATSATDARCRPGTAFSGNIPRTLARMRGSDEAYSVLGFLAGIGTTSIAVCDRSGTVEYQTSAAGAWAPSATTKFADLNRDQQPDLVSVSQGTYRVLPNASGPSGYAFGAPVTGTLSPTVKPDTLWVHDFNGDGLPDLVARVGSSSLVVWPGKGDFSYDTGHVINVVAANGFTLPLTGYTVTFLDANGDGLADVLLEKSTSLSLFLNSGTQLTQVTVPAFGSINWLSSRPVAADLAGTGNPSIAFISASRGYGLDLSAPPVGLLSSANDGKGTVLSFAYAPALPTPGQRVRHALLSNLTVAAAGYDAVSYGYTYTEPTLHSIGEFLVGFGQVSRRGPLETQVDSFLNGDDYSGLPTYSQLFDDLEPQVAKLSTTTYEDVISSFGIHWKRKTGGAKGWRSLGDVIHNDTEITNYTSFANDICPTTEVVTSAAGVLTKDTVLSAPAGFVNALACLPGSLTVIGTHPDTTLDFEHQASIGRTAAGQVTSVTLYDRLGHPLVAQDIGYTPEGLIGSVSTAGKGTAFFSYLPGTPILESTTTAEGVVESVGNRDPVTDAVLSLTTTRGALNYVQNFRYDGLERLASQWNNLGGASAALPNQVFSYRYASGTVPALVETSTLLDAVAKTSSRAAEVDSAAGEALAKAHLVPEGWTFEAVTRTSRATRTAMHFTRPTTTADIASLDVTSLYTGAQLVSSAQSSAFGMPVAADEFYQAGVEGHVGTTLSVNGVLARTDIQNGKYATVTTSDASQRLTSVTDAAGGQTSYTYDALGRVRRVHLADGTIHSLDYDDLGRPGRINRAGVASVAYLYDPASGLLLERDFLGADGTAHAGVVLRKVAYAYDAAGRVARETDTDPSGGSSEVFTFYYDGATAAAPNAKGALGLLTDVVGNGYEKRYTYRADGTVSSTIVSIAGWRQVEVALTYGDDGAALGRTVTVRDGSGHTLLSDKDSAQRDAYGRVAATLRDGVGFSTAVYNGDGQPWSVTFDGPYTHGEIAMLGYDPLTRARVSTALKGSAWSSSVTRGWNDRGLLASESFSIGTFTRQRSYGYSPQGFVSQSADADTTYGYAYDLSGLPSRITSATGSATDDRVLSRAGSVLTAGTHMQLFDDLGRVVQRDGVSITYGPNGQISSAETSARSWSYLYDEKGERIAKLEGGAPVAAYLEGGSYLDGSALTVPISFGDSIIGALVEPTSGAPKQFQLTVTDARGSVLADANGTARLPSPYGDRAAHPDVAAAIDYATKGWDADLGVVRMGVRDYDPSVSRFLEPDPLFLEDLTKVVGSPYEANLYAYAKGDPLDHADPSGRCVEDACVVEGVALFELLEAAAVAARPVVVPAAQWVAQRAAGTILTAYVMAKGAALVQSASATAETRYIFATYTVKLADQKTYSGRTSGVVKEGEQDGEAAERIVRDRWSGHHMRDVAQETAGEVAKPDLDKFAAATVGGRSFADYADVVNAYAAIRGREQQLIEHFGGARSSKDENGNPGTSGNTINGIADDNPLRPYFLGASSVRFGAVGKEEGGTE